MISYVTIGTNDLERAAAFYDELLALIGAKRSAKMADRIFMWSAGGNALAVAKPQNGEPATVGNGTMVSIEANSIDQVFAIYNKAIELGATEDTPARPRGTGAAGFFRDLDGNKLNVIFQQDAPWQK